MNKPNIEKIFFFFFLPTLHDDSGDTNRHGHHDGFNYSLLLLCLPAGRKFAKS